MNARVRAVNTLAPAGFGAPPGLPSRPTTGSRTGGVVIRIRFRRNRPEPTVDLTRVPDRGELGCRTCAISRALPDTLAELDDFFAEHGTGHATWIDISRGRPRRDS